MKGDAFHPPPELTEVFVRLGPHEAHPWRALPWPGVANKVLYFNCLTGATIELARVSEGAEFPAHYHTTVQTQFLISGRLRTGAGQIITPGTFNVIPAGQLHGPFTAEEESIQFKVFSSTPVYILRDGTTYIYRKDGSTIRAGKLEFVRSVEGENFLRSP